MGGPKLASKSVVLQEERVDRNETVAQPMEEENESLELQGSSNLRGLTQIAENRWAFVDMFDQIWSVEDTKEGLEKTKVKVVLPKDRGIGQLALTSIDGRLFLTGRSSIGKPDNQDEEQPYSRSMLAYKSFIGELNTSRAAEWTVGELINIPGEAVGLILKDDKTVGYLTKESRLIDPAAAQTEPSLNVTMVNKRGVELTDLMSVGDDLQLTRSGPQQWLYVEKAGGDQGDVYPMMGMSRWRGRGHQASDLRIGFLDVEGRGEIYRTVRQLDGQLQGYSASILAIAPGLHVDSRKVVVSGGDSLQTLEIDLKAKTVETLSIQPINTHVDPGLTHSTVWSLPGYVGGYYYGGDQVSVNVKDDRIQVALGNYGVCEALLAPPPQVSKTRP